MSSSIIPALRYRDAHAAIVWLGRAFGLHPQAVYDGPDNTVAHAQLTLGGGMIMLGSATNASADTDIALPDELGNRSTVSICLVVSDAAAVYETAKAAGARIVMELQEMDYGGTAFGCKDLEGHSWSIGEYNPWG